MSDYCLVENGQIVDGPRSMPKSWRNTSGYHLNDPSVWAADGWLQVQYVSAGTYNPDLQYRDGYSTDIQANAVIMTEQLKDFTPAEKKQRDYNQWKDQMVATDERWLSQGTMVPMPRVIEEILTKIGLDGIRDEIVEQYNEKRALRANQPPKPEGTE